MNRDCHLIYEAFTAASNAAAPQLSKTSVPPIAVAKVNNTPNPTLPFPKAENAEKSKKTKTIALEDIDTDRKAIHAAYDRVEAIYRTVDDLDRATQIVQAIASVHRNERKRLARKN